MGPTGRTLEVPSARPTKGSMDNPLHWRQIFRLGPSDEDHFIALRAALGVFIPLLVLVAVQRLDLAIFAIFGAFTGVYGRTPGHLDRLIVQPQAEAQQACQGITPVVQGIPQHDAA